MPRQQKMLQKLYPCRGQYWHGCGSGFIQQACRLSFQEVTRGAGNDVFERLARWVDEQTSKAVLGQTMTSDNGSSQAQANVHNDVRHDIAVSDARSLTGSLNRDLVMPYVDLKLRCSGALSKT